MQRQSSLGSSLPNRKPDYYGVDRQAKVTSTKDYELYGRIEAIFLDHSQPAPVWVVGDIDREPVSGDMIIVGFMDGRKDAPYLKGFAKNNSYTTNFITIRKDRIRLQLPVFEIGVKDGKAHKDVQEFLLDEDKLDERAYVELSPDHAIISFPTSEDGPSPPATIKITASDVVIDHPGTIKHHDGEKSVARVGDEIEVVVDGVTYTGTIKTGSSKTKID